MSSSFAPNEQTVISKRAPLPAPSAMLVPSRPSQIGKSLEGQQLGQFMLEEFVGGGGMGAVFRAVDTTLDRIVAVKVVSSEQTDEDTLRRFRNEAQSAARLDHPNIARVYSVGDEAGWHYIVFEFIEGVNVRDLVMHKGALPLDEAISYTIQVADALEHASQRDVIHRDIKPSNLLVMEDGRAKLVDMGLARLHQVESSAEDLTATGVTLGTFDYISPEQARDPRNTDVRSDLYSLGCTLYYMLTGMPPFPEGTVLQKLLSHSSESPPDPRDLRADLPEEISAIAMKLMAKLPAQRYQRPSELSTELMLLCEQLGLVAPTARGLLLPGRNSITRRLVAHVPWLMPVVLLVVCVFGIDALLPQAATLSRSEMMPVGLPVPTILSEQDVEGHNQGSSASVPRQSIDDSQSDSTRESNEPQIPNAPSTPVPETPEMRRGANSEALNPTTTADPNTTDRGDEALPSPVDVTAIMEAASVEAALEVTTIGPAALTVGTDNAEDMELTQGGASDSTEEVAEPVVTSDRLLVIPTGPPTPDPNVVRSIEEALRRLVNQPEIEVIELHCDRYDAKPLTLDLRHDVTIEAGEGFSPHLVFDRRATSFQDEKRMIHLLGGRLTVRGVHFHVNLPYTSDEGWALFHLNQVQELSLERCTMTFRNDYRVASAFIQIQSPRIAEMPLPGSDQPIPPRPNLVIESCIARGEATVVRATAGLPFRLEVSNSLVATTERLVELGQLAEAIPQEIARISLRRTTIEATQGLCRATIRDLEARLPTLVVNAENCVLDHNAGAALIEHIGIRDFAGTMRNAFELSGQANAFPRTEVIWRLELRDGERAEVLWDGRLDGENDWYKDKKSERYASWIDSSRGSDRVMREVIPSDYLVADSEELGFDPELLPALPPYVPVIDDSD